MHFSSLLLHPYHFTREEAAEKHGIIVQTTVPIFDVPPGTRGTAVQAAQTHDDGYSVAIAWPLVPDQSPEHGHAPDADPTPPSDPIIDWFTKSEYERYVIEMTREDA
jgi:hypothetical protein